MYCALYAEEVITLKVQSQEENNNANMQMDFVPLESLSPKLHT